MVKITAVRLKSAFFDSFEVQRGTKRFLNLAKQDQGKARQSH